MGFPDLFVYSIQVTSIKRWVFQIIATLRTWHQQIHSQEKRVHFLFQNTKDQQGWAVVYRRLYVRLASRALF